MVKKVDIPSYTVKPGQVIAMKETSKNLAIVKESLENTVSRLGFVSFDENKGEGTYVRFPERSEFYLKLKKLNRWIL